MISIFMESPDEISFYSKIAAKLTQEEIEFMNSFEIDDGTGLLSLGEYIILMTVRMGALPPSVITILNSKFKQLDVKNEGRISYIDIIQGRRVSKLLALPGMLPPDLSQIVPAEFRGNSIMVNSRNASNSRNSSIVAPEPVGPEIVIPPTMAGGSRGSMMNRRASLQIRRASIQIQTRGSARGILPLTPQQPKKLSRSTLEEFMEEGRISGSGSNFSGKKPEEHKHNEVGEHCVEAWRADPEEDERSSSSSSVSSSADELKMRKVEKKKKSVDKSDDAVTRVSKSKSDGGQKLRESILQNLLIAVETGKWEDDVSDESVSSCADLEDNQKEKVGLSAMYDNISSGSDDEQRQQREPVPSLPEVDRELHTAQRTSQSAMIPIGATLLGSNNTKASLLSDCVIEDIESRPPDPPSDSPVLSKRDVKRVESMRKSQVLLGASSRNVKRSESIQRAQSFRGTRAKTKDMSEKIKKVRYQTSTDENNIFCLGW